MGFRLRKPTVWYRCTLNTVPIVVVPPEDSVGGTGLRRVTLIIRESPQIEIAIDVAPDAIDARDAYWPEPTAGKDLAFHLLPQQFISARASDELHELSVIIEYLEQLE